MKLRYLLLLLALAFTGALTACQTTADDASPTLAPTAEVDPADNAAAPASTTGSEPAAADATNTIEPAPTSIPPTDTPAPTATPEPSPTPSGAINYTYQVVASHPHDANAWTQGLVIDNGSMFEGTGRWGESSLREVDLDTGTILRSAPLETQFFGEGITVLGDRIFQLTWQEGTGFVYDRNTFELLQTFNYPTEGWGITDDGERLIVSDGTANIYFWDPDTLTEIGRLQVRDENGPVNLLNELEYIDGEIWANIWLEDRIARISPETGQVLGWIDMTGLLDPSTLEQPADVLNGIAFDQATGKLFVTGKLWPLLFEITVLPAP